MAPEGFEEEHTVGVLLVCPGRPSGRIVGLFPGTHSVQARPLETGYVAALRSGTVDLLREDLTIAAGAPPAPIEVTVRNDGAELNVALPAGGEANAVVLYSEEYPRRSELVPADGPTTSVSVANLAPGTYRVFAVRDGSSVEYRNPADVERYLDHAARVTVQASEKATVRAELVELPGRPR